LWVPAQRACCSASCSIATAWTRWCSRRRSRDYVEARIRAGLLEQGTTEILREAGVGERLEREGLVHGGIYLRFDGGSHHIPMTELTGRTVTIYGQTEIVKDLVAARLEAGLPLKFECPAVAVEGLDQGEPVVRYKCEDEIRELRCDIVAGCDGPWDLPGDDSIRQAQRLGL